MYKWVNLRGNPYRCKDFYRSLNRMKKKLAEQYPGWTPKIIEAPQWATWTAFLLEREDKDNG
jgi:hypothetical protein